MRQTIDLDRATLPRAPRQPAWRRHTRRNALAYWLISGLLLNQNMRLRGVYRALMLVPWVVPPVVAYISWQWMLNDQSGIINHTLAQLGLIKAPILWLADRNLAMV